MQQTVHLRGDLLLLLALDALVLDRFPRLLRGVDLMRGLVSHGSAPRREPDPAPVARTLRRFAAHPPWPGAPRRAPPSTPLRRSRWHPLPGGPSAATCSGCTTGGP